MFFYCVGPIVLHILALSPQTAPVTRETTAAFVRADTTDTLITRLATITTDTGAFAPGRQDFSHYVTPDLCVAAARMMRANFRRTLLVQEVADTLPLDTVGVGAIAPQARACGGHFTLATTAPSHVGDLFELALDEQNDTLAQAVLATLASHARTPSNRDSVLAFGLNAYLDFGRLALAEALVAQLDKQGTSTHAIHAHLDFLLQEFYRQQATDTVRMRQAVTEELQLAEGFPKPLTVQTYLQDQLTYRHLMALTLATHQDSVSMVATRAQRTLGRYKDTPAVTQQWFWHPWQTLPLDSVVNELAPPWFTYRRRGGGVPAPRLRADYVFLPSGRPANDTVLPVPGKVNLMCFGGSTKELAIPNYLVEGVITHVQASTIKRWLTQYGADNLAVTFVWVARGYDRFPNPDKESWHLFSTLSEEAQLWRWYTQDYVQLPVTVAIQKTQSTWLPAPDGRRVSETPIQFNDYWQHNPDAKNEGVPGEQPNTCVVVGRDGTIEYSTDMNENVYGDRLGNIGALLQSIFQRPASSHSALPAERTQP